MGGRKGEDDKDQVQNRALLGGYNAVKATNIHMSEDGLVGSQKNTFKAFPEETREPSFTTNSPRRADKENALQCSSKASLHPDTEMNDQEARPKAENHLQASGKSKGSYNMQPVDKTHVENAKDGWLSNSPVPVVHHKTTNGHSRTKSNSSSTKSTRKSKRPSGLRINDYDNQCDVVYISQPITECHFESKRVVSSRKTARKSTRGYYYNGECCEIPTVRTLAKTSHVQESGNTLAPRPEVLTSPSQGASLPSDSCLAAAQAMSGDGDKRPAVAVPQGDASNNSTQERDEMCRAEKAAPEVSFVKEREDSSAEASTIALSPPPGLVLRVEKGSLSNSSLQTTLSSRPNEDSGNTGESVVLSASEVASGEESAMFSETEATPEPSILPDQVPPDSMALQPPEDLSPGMDLMPPLEEPGTVKDTSETSKVDDGKELDSEAPAVPQTSEVDNKEGASSKTSPDKKRKREKKPQIVSDRCLRSQQSLSSAEDSPEQSTSSMSLQLPQVQIKFSKSPGAKRFKREVQLDGAASLCFPNDGFHETLLNNIGNSSEQQPGDRNDITMGQASQTLLAKKTIVEEDRNGEGNKDKAGAMLEICLEGDSARRSVRVSAETSDKGEKQSDLTSGTPDNFDSIMEVTEELHTQHGPSSVSRSESKLVPPERSVKSKKPALQFYNLRHTPAPTPVATASKNTSGKETVQGDSNAVTIQAGSNVTDQENAQCEDTVGFSSMDVLSDNKPSFVEWCAEEENQELITNFNTQYMKVQKGWIQLEKEAQPAPKVKNKSDKLKEIWKSKKRTRKLKGPTEGQKLSPVQMLFMKGFDMSNICKWFMETTETKSLVIVKKMNTRLPGDIPLIKLPLQKGCYSGSYPSSLQAERLKKHLKKFAAMTPAKNTIKIQRLWAKLREGSEDKEPEQAASSKQTPPSEVSVEHKAEAKSAQPPSTPVQTSSRILRKYSNLRGKLNAIRKVAKQDKNDSVTKHPSAESKPSGKSLCIKPLVSPKLAQQIQAPPLATKTSLVERGGKGRKAKGKVQEDTSSKGHLQQTKKKSPTESSRSQRLLSTSSKERLPLKKASKPKPAGPPATRKQAAADKSHKPVSGNEKAKKLNDLRPGKRKPPVQKGKSKAGQKASLPSRQEGLAKPPKQKVVRDSSSRPPKVAAQKASSGKALTRSMKRIQESSTAQGKRKLRASKDSSPSKRRCLDAK
uniref:Ligand dependent nuclear receptor corepressor n=1 Tax=Podarcis muralis TaxID=64176 RepID=A0A670HQ91_PODMU